MGNYGSGYTILAIGVGLPALTIGLLYGLFRLVLACIERGSLYLREEAPFPGVAAVVGLNALVPGTGLMTIGSFTQGGILFAMWVLVVGVGSFAARHLSNNLLIFHGFSMLWAGLSVPAELSKIQKKATRPVITRDEAKIQLERQRIPTMEDPDLYIVRLQAFQLLVEAGIGKQGFSGVQKAALNRLKELLRIDEMTYGRILRQAEQHRINGLEIGEGARLGSLGVLEKIIPEAVDHPAFETQGSAFLESAARVLRLSLDEMRARTRAYESGGSFAEGFDPNLETYGSGLSLSASLDRSASLDATATSLGSVEVMVADEVRRGKDKDGED